MRSITYIAILALLFGALNVSAHGEGLSWEVTSGPHLIDVGYEPETFVAGRYIRFDLLLREPVSGEVLTMYDHVWVRIRKDKETLLATGIVRQALGPTTLLYTPDSAGDYALEVSYRDAEGEEVAEAELPFTVSSGSGSFMVPWYVAVLGVLAGALLSRLLPARRT